MAEKSKKLSKAPSQWFSFWAKNGAPAPSSSRATQPPSAPRPTPPTAKPFVQSPLRSSPGSGRHPRQPRPAIQRQGSGQAPAGQPQPPSPPRTTTTTSTTSEVSEAMEGANPPKDVNPDSSSGATKGDVTKDEPQANPPVVENREPVPKDEPQANPPVVENREPHPLPPPDPTTEEPRFDQENKNDEIRPKSEKIRRVVTFEEPKPDHTLHETSVSGALHDESSKATEEQDDDQTTGLNAPVPHLVEPTGSPKPEDMGSTELLPVPKPSEDKVIPQDRSEVVKNEPDTNEDSKPAEPIPQKTHESSTARRPPDTTEIPLRHDEERPRSRKGRREIVVGTGTMPHKDIGGGLSSLVQNLGIDGNAGTEKGVCIITLAGENKGASMVIGDNGGLPIHGSYYRLADRTEPVADESGLDGKSGRSRIPILCNTSVNSNTQGVNNSILGDSCCHERDAGVHLVVATHPLEANYFKGEMRRAISERTQAVVVRNEEPAVRRRCLRALFLEDSGEEGDETQRRRHGCRYTCGEKSGF